MQACETICLKSESFWQGDRDRAAVSWHSYPRLVHHKAPHLKESWKLVQWFNTRTAGSSHLVTWNCKVICEERLLEISSDMLRGYACCCLSISEKGHLLNVLSTLFSCSITSFLIVFFPPFLMKQPKSNMFS